MLLFSLVSQAQKKVNLNTLNPGLEYENIHVKKLDSDSNSTSFLIWIKNHVKEHKHEHHSEVIYVIEGKGEMTIGNNSFKIKTGDYFKIPKNTYHALKVSDTIPIKVISVQAPEFFGKDRVFK